MKTKEFIEKLKTADPSGECHVRITGGAVGIPTFCEQKEGYWDGPYDYIDENNNWVRTTEGNKVDIHCIDINDFVSRNVHVHSMGGITPWEEIKKKFVTDTTYSNESHNDEIYNNLIEEAKEDYDMIVEITERSYNKSLDEMIENAKKGWKWFQDKLVDTPEKGKPNFHVYYTWKIFDENNKSVNGSNIHMTESIQKSGQWEKLDNDEMSGYYEWKFIK